MSVYITEYAKVASGNHGAAIQAGEEPPLAEQKISAGGNVEFNSETRLVMVHTDAVVHIAFGDNPTASTSNRRLPADTTIFYGLPNGRKLKMSTVAGS